MDTNQNRLVLLPLALDECEVLLSVALLTEGNHTEMTIFGRHIHLDTLLDNALLLQAVGNHILDGDNLQLVLLGKLHQLGQTGHGAVFVHNLDECTGRIESCQLTQVDGCFGMSRTAQHTIVLSIQRTDVSRAPEGLGR